MIKFINDNGIVINKRDFGEADRYVSVFTENFGKLVFLLKGIRKSKKRELSSVDILTLSKFTFYRKGENYAVSSFNEVDSYLEIKSDLDNLGIALYILAILNEILVENNRKKSLYNITIKTLNYLKESEKYSYKVSQEEKEIVELFITGKVRNIIEGSYLFENIKEVVVLFEKYINFHLGVQLKLKNYVMGVEND